jgi:hypothetical protein
MTVVMNEFFADIDQIIATATPLLESPEFHEMAEKLITGLNQTKKAFYEQCPELKPDDIE